MHRFSCLAVVCSVVLGCSGSGGESTPADPDTGTDTFAPEVATDAAIADASDVAVDSGGPCLNDGECAASPDGKACDVATGKCVPCTASSDLCPASEHCDVATKKCVAGCKSDDGCVAAGDAGLDGGDGGEVGDGGAPSKSRCDVATNTCVECAKDDHCAAGFLCVGNVCSAGCSTTKPCAGSDTCCAGACVDTQTNTDHCGTCAAKCTPTTGTAKCEAGACKVATCTGTLADCDGNFANGCEVDTATTLAHCGACGTACPTRPNSTASCATGACGLVCNAGFADCDGDASNGCEVNLSTDPTHCGACTTACSTTNGTPACVAGACTIGACTAPFSSCDLNTANGCETNTSNDVSHCGACGNACALPNATPSCTAGVCNSDVCVAGFGNCNTVAADGCETNTRTDVDHCGGCGMVCPAVANGVRGCASGACVIASCNGAFRNCNSNYADGCEVNTANDVANCGGCGVACPSRPNAAPACVSGACGFACTGAFRDCDGSAINGCESNTQSDRNHCGACGFACGAGLVCNSGACAAPASCQALRTANPSAPSGRYTIDPDAGGSIAPFDVYCEMIGTEGWTLALKANGAAGTFSYSSTHWTTSTTLNTTSTDLSLTEAKFASFNTMPFTQLRLGMVDAGVPRYITVNATGTQSMMATFAAGYLATTATRATWLSLVATPRMQANCNREGLSNAVATYASVRIGILANQEGDCGSPDSFVGFGAGPMACLAGTTPLTVGNVGACGASPSDGVTTTFGYVFLR